jgi:hypothetical protein
MSSGAYSRIEISCLEGRAQSIRLRQKLLHSLYNGLKSSTSALKEAIAADSGNGEAEVALELALTISELRTHYDTLNVEEDLKEQRSPENLNATTNIGIIYVIPTKQNLFYSVISALTAALAAGNCVIVEVGPASNTLASISTVLTSSVPATSDSYSSIWIVAQDPPVGIGCGRLYDQQHKTIRNIPVEMPCSCADRWRPGDGQPFPALSKGGGSR